MKRVALDASLLNHPILAQMKANHHSIQAKVSLVMTVILLAMTSWVLGKVVWLMVPQPMTLPIWQPSAQTSASISAQESIDFTALHKANLFGQYQATQKQKPQQQVIKDAPKTRLSLTVVGVVASDNAKTSLAVIANRGQQATYGIGEKIAGTRAELKAVLTDRIIIDNQGRDETVMLQGMKYRHLSDKSSSQARTVQHTQTTLSRDRVAKIRAEIQKTPQDVFKYINISPVKQEGGVIGYRVSPGRDSALFRDAGLKMGDIAVRLNGIDLSTPSAARQVMKVMQNPQELQLTVERDGQQYDITIEL